MAESGGFGAAPGHDAHMLYTVSSVQILATLDAFDELEAKVPGGREKIGKCTSACGTPPNPGWDFVEDDTC